MSSIARFLRIVAIVAFQANTGLGLQLTGHSRSREAARAKQQPFWLPTEAQQRGQAKGLEKVFSGPQKIYRDVREMVSGVTEWTRQTASYGKDVLVGRTRAGTVVRVVCVVEAACLMADPSGKTIAVQAEVLGSVLNGLAKSVKWIAPRAAGSVKWIAPKAAGLAWNGIAKGANFAYYHPQIAAGVASHAAIIGAGVVRGVRKAQDDERAKRNLLKKQSAEGRNLEAFRMRQAAAVRAGQAVGFESPSADW
jgi:hypothetical protein